ncbi:MAG: hypothetical protein LBK68_00275 [Candidatus Margulisbacteria bacterium]|jgi:hypothetical protein|nr:hypothetical protein [Candidatus Margulisiibacteriota bacterium]
MHTAEFEAVVKDGKIELPQQYQNEFFTHVKVFLLEKTSSGAKKINPINNLYGALADGANPTLWEKEKTAWRIAAAKKYAPR